MDKRPGRLVQALLAKSVLEVLFLLTLVTLFSLNTFPPIRGSVEITPNGINGWAVNTIEPVKRVEVQLFIDQKLVARGDANISRPDVAAAGFAADEWHGFYFPVTAIAQGVHQARVYGVHESAAAARRTMQTIGDPVLFEVRGGILTKIER